MISIFQLNRSGVHHKQSTLSEFQVPPCFGPNLLFRPVMSLGPLFYQPLVIAEVIEL